MAMRAFGRILLAVLAAWWLVMFAVYAIGGEWSRAAWFLALEVALVAVVVWRTRLA